MKKVLVCVLWYLLFVTNVCAQVKSVSYTHLRGDYPTYHYNSSSDQYEINPNKKYDYGTYSVTSGTERATKDLNIQASLNYARVFNGNHDVTDVYKRQV